MEQGIYFKPMGKPRQPSTQKYLKKVNPPAKSAFIKRAVDAILQMKQSEGNPHPINQIGSQNLMNILQSFSNAFSNPPNDGLNDVLEALRRFKVLCEEKLELWEQVKKNQENGIDVEEDVVMWRESASALIRVIVVFADANFGSVDAMLGFADASGILLRLPFETLRDTIDSADIVAASATTIAIAIRSPA